MEYESDNLIIDERAMGEVCGELTRLGAVLKNIESVDRERKRIEFDLPASAQGEWEEYVRSLDALTLDTIYCSFCGKGKSEVERMLEGPSGAVYICNECVISCMELMSGKGDVE